jgi:outer membrane protein assembly factor BamB
MITVTRGYRTVNCTAVSRRLLVTIVLVVCGQSARADNWPQWRGPTNNGVSRETNIPAEWSADKNIDWKLKLPGSSGATPIVWGERIFLTSADGDDIVLLCVSTDGKVLWKSSLGHGKGRFRYDEGNNASPSPSTDGKHVYAFAGTGDFACFDFDGKQVWHFNAQERYGKFRIMHGMHTTPVLDGDRLYFQLLHSNGAWVIALDKATGEEVWKVARTSDARAECKEAYTSPCIWRNGKEEYLVTLGCDYAIAHRLSDGSEIWRLAGLNPKKGYNPTLRLVASPLATPDLIIVPSAKDGPVVGLKPDAHGLVETGSDFEQWVRPHNTPDVPSPLVYDGLLYLCREYGALICMDARTGKELYTESLHKARYRASPVYADGKIYLTARDGVVTVVQAGPKFKQLFVNRLPDQLAASPVVANGRLYLRGFDALYAIGNAK